MSKMTRIKNICVEVFKKICAKYTPALLCGKKPKIAILFKCREPMLAFKVVNYVGLRVVVKENYLLSSVNLDLVELESVFES